MAILDMQGLETPQAIRAGKSGASKQCFNAGGGKSGVSLALCKGL